MGKRGADPGIRPARATVGRAPTAEDGLGAAASAAVIHPTGVVVGPSAVDQKTNAMKVAQPLRDPLDLVGHVVTADAMPTQADFARYGVDDNQADSVLTVQDNQRLRTMHLAQRTWEFPPSGGTPP